jgi:hypothetical protein
MKRITSLIASILCLISCNNVIDDFDNGKGGNGEGVQFALNIPGPAVLTYSAATESECWIDEIWVLVFQNATTTGALLHDTLINGTDIDNFYKGKATQLLPQLPYKASELDGKTLVFIANSGHTTLPSLTTYGDVNGKFTLPSKYFVEGDHLPMYGEIQNWSSSDPNYSCKMIRAVAKIQVKFSDRIIAEDFSTGNFMGATKHKFCLYNYALSGFIQPGSNVGIPPMASNYTTDISLFNSSGAVPPLSVYMYEYPTSTRDISGNEIRPEDFNKARQFLMLYDISSTMGHGYWRLDFYDALTKEFIDIKRNCHYIFTIDKIYSEPYAPAPGGSFPDEALNNPGSNIEYTLKASDGASHVTSNGQYAIETNVDTVYVPVGVASSVTIIARYLLPTGIALAPGTTNIVGNSLPAGMSWSSSPPPPLTASYQDYTVNISGSYTGPGAAISFGLGNIYHYVSIKTK